MKPHHYGALVGCVALALHQLAFGQTSAENVLRLAPKDAAAVIIVPHPKRCSDQLTQLLEGMDRGGAVMGRPIDQLKSMAGFNAAVNDMGACAIALFSVDGVGEVAAPAWAALVPVTDAESFLRDNYVGREGEAWLRRDGQRHFATPLDSHVLISNDRRVIAGYAADNDLLDGVNTAMGGERVQRMFAAGEASIFITPRGARMLEQAVKAELVDRALPGAAVGGIKAFEAFETGIVSIDFDPLGVIVRTLGASRIDAPASNDVDDNLVNDGLSRLPGKPFYIAMSADLAAMGGKAAANAWRDALGLPELPAWMLEADSIDFAVYPSPAGLAGGLLNDAVAVLRTRQPQAVRESIRQQILASEKAFEGVKRTATWKADQPVQAAGVADAYEIKTIDAPPELAQAQMIEQLVFGRGGWRGFVAASSDAVVMTFSQRPAVLKGAVEANAAKTGLAAIPAIRMMRGWMPAQRDIEAYVNVAQFTKIARQAAESFGMTGQAPMPLMDENLPPIGFAADVDGNVIETATIIPAGVAAAMFDQAAANMMRAKE